MDFSTLKTRICGTPLEPLTPLLAEDFLGQIRHGDFRRWRRLLAELPKLPVSASELGATVVIGRRQDLDDQTRNSLEAQLKEFIPWRKGPFEVFGVAIDSEWQCQLKWNRLADSIAPLTGRTVLDVGCGNGYYGFRMVQAGAELVIGIDQHIPYVAQFWAIRHFLPELPVYVMPVALEQLPAKLEYFDTVFSMGVLYHARAPLDHLLALKSALRPGGELVLETLYVEGAEGYCLTPPGHYARMPRIWFVPTIATLQNWLARLGFENICIIDESVTTEEEQRSTPWMPFESLAAALDPADPSVTIEGLPAPRRVLLKASNK